MDLSNIEKKWNRYSKDWEGWKEYLLEHPEDLEKKYPEKEVHLLAEQIYQDYKKMSNLEKKFVNSRYPGLFKEAENEATWPWY